MDNKRLKQNCLAEINKHFEVKNLQGCKHFPNGSMNCNECQEAYENLLIKKASLKEAVKTKKKMYSNFLNEIRQREEGAQNQGNIIWKRMWKDLKVYLKLKLKELKQ